MKDKENGFNYIDSIFDLDVFGAIQIPHHGSRDNFDEEIISKACNAHVYFTSAGEKNHYGHPHCKVIKTLLHNYKFIAIVSESSEPFVMNFKIYNF